MSAATLVGVVMRESNFFSFGVVFGFFIGLVVAIIVSKDVLEVLPVTLAVTFFFYLLSHISVALFLRFSEFGKVYFEKEEFEKRLDSFFEQIQKREVEVDSNYEFIEEIEKSLEEDEKS